LCVTLAPGAAELRPHLDALMRLCSRCLQSELRGRNCELSFQLLQVLVVQADENAGLGLLQDLLTELFTRWLTTSSLQTNGHSEYPLHSMLQLFCTWHARHRTNFCQRVSSLAPSASHVARTLLSSYRLVRPVTLRASLLCSTLSLAESDGADPAFWQELLRCCDDLACSGQKKATSVLLSQTLQSLKASLGTKLPVPARSAGVLQRCLLPRDAVEGELRSTVHEDGSLDDAAVARWFFARCASCLRQLGTRGVLDPQALIAVAPESALAALRASGL